MLLVAPRALAKPVLPSGQLVWETPKGFVLTNPLGGGASSLPALPPYIQPWRVALSPSGTTLVIESFNRTTEPPGMNLYLSNLNTGGSRLLVKFPPLLTNAADYLNGIGAFSPDGKAVAYGFTAKGGEGVVFMRLADGHKIRSILIPGAVAVPVFQWLPDGRLLVQDGNGLETVSKTGTGARPINIGLPPGESQINTAVASPDGSEVAIEVDTGPGCSVEGPCNSAVYLAPTAGGTAVRLASSESNTIPVWSPDGKFLIYGSLRGTELMRLATRRTVTIRARKGSIVGWRAAP